MLSLKQIREYEPKLKHATDAEVALIRAKLYELGHIAMDSYLEQNDSNFPVGSTQIDEGK
jgi:hypothetical protein